MSSGHILSAGYVNLFSLEQENNYMAETKLAKRLAEILEMLYAGDSISTNALAEHFSVSPRTIRRDLAERLSFLNLVSTHEGWKLQDSTDEIFNTKVIDSFAEKIGVQNLLPYFDDAILKSLVGTNGDSPYLIKQSEFEQLEAPFAKLKFSKLEGAIRQKKQISFSYHNKLYSDIEPYKLVHFDGFWYLAAVDNRKLKAFHVSLIKAVGVTNINFVPDANIHIKINNDETIWFSENKMQVTLIVAPEVSQYFKRKKFFPEQQTICQGSHKPLMVTTNIVSRQQLFPLLMRWIPHIKIIEPAFLQDELINQLTTYIN